MELIAPSAEFKDSYIQYIQELGSEERYPFPLDFAYNNFDALLEKLNNFSLGINLPKGYVPSSTLWLIENDELIGVTNIRHFLNADIEHCGGHIGLGIRPSYRGKGIGKVLMKLSIEQLFAMGISDIHIHCYKHNVSSAACIIACGGALHSEISVDDSVVQRFIVRLG